MSRRRTALAGGQPHSHSEMETPTARDSSTASNLFVANRRFRIELRSIEKWRHRSWADALIATYTVPPLLRGPVSVDITVYRPLGDNQQTSRWPQCQPEIAAMAQSAIRGLVWAGILVDTSQVMRLNIVKAISIDRKVDPRDRSCAQITVEELRFEQKFAVPE